MKENPNKGTGLWSSLVRFSLETVTTTSTRRTSLILRSTDGTSEFCHGSGTGASRCDWSCSAVMSSSDPSASSSSRYLLFPPSFCTVLLWAAGGSRQISPPEAGWRVLFFFLLLILILPILFSIHCHPVRAQGSTGLCWCCLDSDPGSVLSGTSDPQLVMYRGSHVCFGTKHTYQKTWLRSLFFIMMSEICLLSEFLIWCGFRIFLCCGLTFSS